MSNYDDLKTIEELREKGALTEEEYQREKDKILNKDYKIQSYPDKSAFFGMNENSYLALMHISLLAGFIVPLLGLIAPIVLWTISKDKSENVDKHGKNILNFTISWIIYFCTAGVLCFLLIGFPILIALVVIGIIFIIMATIKASNGEYWKYPFTIEFIK